jgi:hypothetical protein
VKPYELPSSFRGWLLAPADRASLLTRLPPVYGTVVADHVTFSGPTGATMPRIDSARVVGRTDDGRGVEALAVEINGTTNRPDGSTYHLTWSLGPGRDAHESNDVLRAQGWQPVEPVAIVLTPTIAA